EWTFRGVADERRPGLQRHVGDERRRRRQLRLIESPLFAFAGRGAHRCHDQYRTLECHEPARSHTPPPAAHVAGTPPPSTRGTAYAARMLSIDACRRSMMSLISFLNVVSPRRTPIAMSKTKGRYGRSICGLTGTIS